MIHAPNRKNRISVRSRVVATSVCSDSESADEFVAASDACPKNSMSVHEVEERQSDHSDYCVLN